MFSRVESDGVVFYQSSLLAQAGVVHGFSTRIGGLSTGPFAALNLGNLSGDGPKDSPENVAENHRRFQAALALPDAPRAWVQQVHSNRVELVESEGETEYAETIEAEVRDRYHGQLQADGLLTELPGVLLTVRVADCVPVLLAADDGRVVAAVHAGWRGVVAGIVGRAVRAFGECGTPPGRIVAAVGPAIGVEHFEVGPEVAEAFTRAGLSAAVATRPEWPKPHVALAKAVEMQLHAAGVQQCDVAALCTFPRADEFYSHRRDHGLTGRMAAGIARAVQ